jgi:TorA maturation chaperone TorD
MSVNTFATGVDPALNLAHQALYRFTALCLLDPKAGTWELLRALRQSTLVNDAAELIRSDPAAWPAALGRGELPAAELDPARVFDRLPDAADELNRQYEAAFGLLVSSACPPYETEYINGKFAVQRSQTLADISGFYSAFGLRPSSVRPERHDHIVLELEFMAFLLGLELQAARENGRLSEEYVGVCQAARERFFREHLGAWSPAFAHLLASEVGDKSFYASVARLLAALLTTQRRHYGLPTPDRTPRPSPLERPEECEGCALSPM